MTIDSQLRVLALVIPIFFTLIAPAGYAQFGSGVYQDGNGYFLSQRPKGWIQQDFPEETVRSKIAFRHPERSAVYIQVIAGPTPNESDTLESLLQEGRDKIMSVLKPRFPNGSFTIVKKTIGDREALLNHNSVPGSTEQQIVSYVNKGTYYSLAFNAASRHEYEIVSTVFRRFLDSFIILERGAKATDAERRAALVAKYRRLARLYDQAGQKAEALAWIDEGLAVDPNDPELQQMQTRLRAARK